LDRPEELALTDEEGFEMAGEATKVLTINSHWLVNLHSSYNEMLACIFFMSSMISYSKSTDDVSFNKGCKDEVVLVATPFVKLLGMDVSPLPPIRDTLGLWPGAPLEEGVDGWLVLVGGRILLKKAIFFYLRVWSLTQFPYS